MLQGGYNVESIANSALACVRVLLGDPAPRISITAASACATEAVHLVKLAQRPFWKALGGPLLESEERQSTVFRSLSCIDLYSIAELRQAGPVASLSGGYRLQSTLESITDF